MSDPVENEGNTSLKPYGHPPAMAAQYEHAVVATHRAAILVTLPA